VLAGFIGAAFLPHPMMAAIASVSMRAARTDRVRMEWVGTDRVAVIGFSCVTKF
jgi:hypothetical protein